MIRFVLKRLGLIVVSLFAASIIIFLITEIIPGDVAQMILGQNVTPDSLAALRERLGLMNPPSCPLSPLDRRGGRRATSETHSPCRVSPSRISSPAGG